MPPPTASAAPSQSGANSNVASLGVGANDATFLVCAVVNVTAFVAGTFDVQVAYTDETGAAVTANPPITQNDGTSHTAIPQGGQLGQYYTHPLTIRAKANTTITVKTAGTFTNLTYSVAASIQRISP